MYELGPLLLIGDHVWTQAPPALPHAGGDHNHVVQLAHNRINAESGAGTGAGGGAARDEDTDAEGMDTPGLPDTRLPNASPTTLTDLDNLRPYERGTPTSGA